MSRTNDEKIKIFSKLMKDNKVNISPFNLNFKDYQKFLKVAGTKFFHQPKNFFNQMSKKQLMKGFNMLKNEVKQMFLK